MLPGDRVTMVTTIRDKCTIGKDKDLRKDDINHSRVLKISMSERHKTKNKLNL